MVKAHIQRAHLLKIHFYGCEKSDSRPQVEMLQCLVEHTSRWQELSIGLTSKLVPLLDGVRDRVPMLRRFSIEWDVPESQAGVESIDCFQTAPSLVDATTFLERSYVPTLLPAHQLTRYNLDGPWTMHRSILALAQNLVQARIQVIFDEDDWPDSSEIIDLSRLHRLYVSNLEILKYLRTPVLQEIAFENGPEDEYLPYLDPFMLRSGCTLRRLSFSGSPTTAAIAEILHKYPSIIELAMLVHHLDDCENADDFISHLAILDPRGCGSSPQLSEISFGCYSDSSIDYALYLHMLQSRWKAEGCALKNAALLTSSETDLDFATLHALDTLGQDGMDILVLHGTEATDVMDGWVYHPTWN
ncbi:hypothetical protein C8R44DRAFT_767122 [Mycena epipterygia]|nr:hypothetical protein C8R44DRAFT_767122 [Mycena epipterygia]